MRHQTKPGSHTPQRLALALTAASALACSGPAQQQRRPAPEEAAPTPEQGSANQDRLDEVNRLCTRKAGIAVPTCWNDEYMRTKKKFEAQVTLMILVGASGKAEEVKVVSSTSQSKELLECMQREAKGWSYPEGKEALPVYCTFFLRSSM